MLLQCKCRSSQKPTIKWFKKKDESRNGNLHTLESYKSFVESSRSIKYFENFYEPLVSPGLKELGDSIYLSKLMINNITQNSIHVCVAINYFGFTFREILIDIASNDTVEDDKLFEFPEKNSEILFFILLILLVPITMLMITILYLLIHRQILGNKK